MGRVLRVSNRASPRPSRDPSAVEVRLADTLDALRRSGTRKNVLGRARFGIADSTGFGVAVPDLRRLARGLRPDHALAAALWRTGSLDARLLAAMVDDPAEVNRDQMERWVREFDSWALCDGCCQDLFCRTSLAWTMADAWSRRPEEYVKRAGFTMYAELAVHDRDALDRQFLPALRRIYEESTDERRYVRKGANWALRAIGKRNARLRAAAIRTSRRIQRIRSPTARWIASDALRELSRVRRFTELPVKLGPTSRRRRPGSPARGTRRAAGSTPSSPRRRAAARR